MGVPDSKSDGEELGVKLNLKYDGEAEGNTVSAPMRISFINTDLLEELFI